MVICPAVIIQRTEADNVCWGSISLVVVLVQCVQTSIDRMLDIPVAGVTGLLVPLFDERL